MRPINAKWATSDWTPILLDLADNYPRSVAALRRYDVLVVNPIRDGLNLVAKEGPLVNERDGVLVLSPGAGAWDELGCHAVEAHPFDVAGTAEALATALSMPADERATPGPGPQEDGIGPDADGLVLRPAGPPAGPLTASQR